MKQKYRINWKIILPVMLLIYLFTDILIHKGQFRFLLPASFNSHILSDSLLRCEATVENKSIIWAKGVNTISAIDRLGDEAGGMEIDVYFDTSSNNFYVYHDSSSISKTTLRDILDVYRKKELDFSVWLDFKNLNAVNCDPALKYLLEIKDEYHLQNKMIIESSEISLLRPFCEKNFYTVFYLPFFNPYLMNKKELNILAEKINSELKQNQVSAISGYYFQIPFIKKNFEHYALLTWISESRFSVVSWLFTHKITSDKNVKIVLVGGE
ncbi:MAG: hypothetical protein J5I50_03770 [Chitinophagaceae bacterium]|nr:hypothetical protein [Chitinophagaceae bacterium]